MFEETCWFFEIFQKPKTNRFQSPKKNSFKNLEPEEVIQRVEGLRLPKNHPTQDRT
jgi:hypothetical protein